MSEQLTLAAEPREQAGKGAARAIRREGRVPAVIYGERKEPVQVHVEEKALAKMLSTGSFMNSVVMVDIAGKANRTLPKDVQFHPVTDRPIHVDFLRIGAHSKVSVAIPVHFKNEEESPGLERGGVLNIVQHDLEITVDASAIPEEIVVDLAGLEIGDSIHLDAIKLPEGAKATIDDPSFTIATIVAPSAMKQDEEEAAAADAVPATEGGEAEGGEAAPEGESEDKKEG